MLLGDPPARCLGHPAQQAAIWRNIDVAGGVTKRAPPHPIPGRFYTTIDDPHR
jgi:hypothetical protein